MPLSAQDYVNQGSMKFQKGLYEEAIVDFDIAIKLDPNNAYAYGMRGDSKVQLCQNKEAIEDLNKYILAFPNQPWGYSKRGEAKRMLAGQQEGNFALTREAILDFDKVIYFEPRNDNVYHLRAFAKQYLKQYQESLADFNQAIALNPVPIRYAHRAQLKYSFGHYQEAIQDYAQAIASNPNHDVMAVIDYSWIARIYLKLGSYQKAIDTCNKVIALDPKLVEDVVVGAIIYRALGEAKLKLGRHKEALADFNKAISISPNDCYGYIRRGDAKKLIGDYQGAKSDYERGMIDYPRFIKCDDEDTRNYFVDLETKLKEVIAEIKKREEALFFELASAGNLDEMQRLARNSQIKSNIRNANGETALHHAAATDNLNTVKWLIETEGLDNEIEDGKGATPLHWAAKNGRLTIIQWLVEKHQVNLHKTDNKGRTALHHAAKSGYLHIVKYLVEHGLDIEVTDAQGRTALQCATAKEVIKYLESPDVFLAKAESLFRQHRHAEALTYYLKVLERNPTHVNALAAAGNLLNILGHYEEALTYFDKVLQTSNNQNSAARAGKHKALFEIGSQWARKKNYSSALDYYQQAIALEVTNKTYLTQAGIVLRILKRYPEAIDMFDKVLVSYANDHNAQQEKRLAVSAYVDQLLEESDVLIAQQQYDKAYKQLNQALALDTQNVKLFMKLAQVAEWLQEEDHALEYYTRLLQIDGENTLAFDKKCDLLEKKGQAYFNQRQFKTS